MAAGIQTRAAMVRALVWNTAVSVNVANAGLLLRSVGLPSGLGNLLYDQSLGGSGFPVNAIRGLVKPTGTLPAYLRYLGLGLPLALAMGTAGVPTQEAATTAYRHRLQLSSSLDGLYATFAIDKVVSIWEYPTVALGGFTITLTADGLAEIEFQAVASSVRITSGQINTTLAAVTYRSRALNVFGDHIKVRMNAQSAAALADTDRIYPSRLVFTYNRNIDGDFVFSGGRVQTAPTYAGDPTIQVAMDFPVYGSDTLQQGNSIIAAAESEIVQKLDITITSPVLAGVGFPYQMVIQAPHVVVAEVDARVDGPAKIPVSATLALVTANAAPLGMTGLTQPFELLLTDTVTTNYLA